MGEDAGWVGGEEAEGALVVLAAAMAAGAGREAGLVGMVEVRVVVVTVAGADGGMETAGAMGEEVEKEGVRAAWGAMVGLAGLAEVWAGMAVEVRQVVDSGRGVAAAEAAMEAADLAGAAEAAAVMVEGRIGSVGEEGKGK